MDIGSTVKVSNKHQINYPKKGLVRHLMTNSSGVEYVNVAFSRYTDCWYLLTDVTQVKRGIKLEGVEFTSSNSGIITEEEFFATKRK